jgi:hypothetical protein
MNSTLASCYVYYRVRPEHAAELRVVVHALMKDLRERVGVAGRLARQRDDADLWMEIYDDIADAAAFERELDAAAARLDVARLLRDGSCRKTEIFVPMAMGGG